MTTQGDGDELSLRVPIKGNMIYPDVETILYDQKGDETLYSASDKDKNKGIKLENKSTTSLHELLRPVLILLALSACYTYDDNYIKGKDQSMSKKKIVGTVYRGLCLMICLLFCSLGLATLSMTYESRSLHILKMIWHFQCLFVLIIFLKADSCKFGNFRQVIHFWDKKISPAMEILEIKIPTDKVKVRQKIFIIIAAALIIFNVAASGLLGSSLFPGTFKGFYTAPFPYTIQLSITFIVLSIPISCLWIVPVFYVMTVSVLLSTSFEAYNNFLATFLSKTLTTKTCKLHKLRQLHLNLCKAVSDLDRDLNYYNANMFVFSIGLACYNLYQIIKFPMSTLNMCMFVFWMVSSLVFLAVMSIYAAFVNEAAHGSLNTLYYLCIKDINKEQLGQLNMFLSKLTGPPIGFTTAGLLTITKEFLLTITGVFLTYFFVLYTL